MAQLIVTHVFPKVADLITQIYEVNFYDTPIDRTIKRGINMRASHLLEEQFLFDEETDFPDSFQIAEWVNEACSEIIDWLGTVVKSPIVYGLVVLDDKGTTVIVLKSEENNGRPY